MTAELERSYARLLRLFPPGYRRERGDEMLDALLESGATRLSLRERQALVLSAVRVRAGATDRRDLGATWRQSAALAAAMLMVFGAATAVSDQISWGAGDDWRQYAAAALGLAGVFLVFSRWLPVAIGLAVAAYVVPMVGEGGLSFSLSVEWLLAAALLIPATVRRGKATVRRGKAAVRGGEAAVRGGEAAVRGGEAAVRGERAQWRQSYLLVLPLAVLDPALVPSLLQSGWLVVLAVVILWAVIDERAALAFGLMLTVGVVTQGTAWLYGIATEPTYTVLWLVWPGVMLAAGAVVARRRARI